jgi:hypothetical protein
MRASERVEQRQKRKTLAKITAHEQLSIALVTIPVFVKRQSKQ